MNPLDLGADLEVAADGGRVALDPREGPLLILGMPGAGSSLALKRLFRNLCASANAGPVDAIGAPLLLDSDGDGAYARVAADAGAAHLTVVPDGRKGEMHPLSPEQRRAPVVVSGGGLDRGCSAECMAPTGPCGRLKDLLHGGRPRHLFVDDLHGVIHHEVAGALPLWAWKYGPEHGVFSAGVLEAQRAHLFADNRSTARILTCSRRILLMRTHSPERLLPKPLLNAIRASTRREDILETLPLLSPGHAFLVDKPPRGVRPRPAVRLHIDVTDEEFRLFNTDPAREVQPR